uniref:Ovule protein n=1 Tax=Steinernema glaseri TaxID=37863 RepID=A0A1I8AV75_9BILA
MVLRVHLSLKEETNEDMKHGLGASGLIGVPHLTVVAAIADHFFADLRDRQELLLVAILSTISFFSDPPLSKQSCVYYVWSSVVCIISNSIAKVP